MSRVVPVKAELTEIRHLSRTVVLLSRHMLRCYTRQPRTRCVVRSHHCRCCWFYFYFSSRWNMKNQTENPSNKPLRQRTVKTLKDKEWSVNWRLNLASNHFTETSSALIGPSAPIRTNRCDRSGAHPSLHKHAIYTNWFTHVLQDRIVISVTNRTEPKAH